MGAVRDRAADCPAAGPGMAAAHPGGGDRLAARARQPRGPDDAAGVRPRAVDAGTAGRGQSQGADGTRLSPGDPHDGGADAARLPQAGPVGAGRQTHGPLLQSDRAGRRAGRGRGAGGVAASAWPVKGDDQGTAGADRADPGRPPWTGGGSASCAVLVLPAGELPCRSGRTAWASRPHRHCTRPCRRRRRWCCGPENRCRSIPPA